MSERIMKMKDGTECHIGINWEDVELKTFKLDQEIIDEIFETDYSKMDELYKKYKTDSWGYYFKKKDGHPLNDQSDQVSFENSDIRNNLLLGLIRFKQRIESNPPKIIWDSLTSNNRKLLKTSFSVLHKETDEEIWKAKVWELYSKYLEQCHCDFDDPFEIQMEDIEDVIKGSWLKPEIHLKDMRDEVYGMIDEFNKQFMEVK